MLFFIILQIEIIKKKKEKIKKRENIKDFKVLFQKYKYIYSTVFRN